ncbi:MAG: universal stress protein [Deltaproteobacteria bacterium]|nr:universal stress protein [Deltaproteobacteria bacterium]
MEFKKILCPIDFSEVSRESLQKAAELAQQFHAELVVAHVITNAPWLVAPTPTMPVDITGFHNELHEAAGKSLEQMVNEVVPEQVGFETVLETGDPARDIVDIAADKQVDLIVMASHEKVPLNRFLFGSVAEKVIRIANCPVLVLKGPQ